METCQDDIRREELDGECRDATEEEAEERPYPEDPSDWPAPHQITDTFRQNMTETGPLKCPDGPYPRSMRVTGDFQKPTLIEIGRELSENGYYVHFKFMKQVTII